MDSSKKKILFLDQCDFVGGAQLSLFEHIKYLNKEKFDVSVAISHKAEKNDLPKRYRELGVDVLTLKLGQLKLTSVKSLFDLRSAINNLQKIMAENNFDLIVTNTVRTALIATLAFRTKARIIWLIRDFTFPRPLFRFLSGFVSLIIYNARGIKEHYEKANRGHTTSEIVHSGRNTEVTELSAEKKKEIRTELGIEPNTFVIAYVGRLVEEKGPQVLIRAMQEIDIKNKDTICLIFGTGAGQKGNNEESLKEEVERSGLEDKIKFFGFRNDARELLPAFDCLVVPSVFNDPLPGNIIDAMVSRVVVVASDVGGVGEIVADKQTGYLFKAGDANGLSAILKDLFKVVDPKILAQAQENVREHFSIQKNTLLLEELYLKNIK